MMPDQETLEDLQRRCMQWRRRILDAALRAVPDAALRQHAASLGLAVTDELAQVPEEDLAYAVDLALFARTGSRASAVARAAASRAFAGDADGAAVAAGLATAWFSVFRLDGPHPVLGHIAEDLLRGGWVWVMDSAVADWAGEGPILAARLARVRGFAITSGTPALLDGARSATVRGILAASGLEPAALADDPRFAALAYRQAIGIA
jgi:hypothetical protein